MKITFLGTSHGVPEPNRRCSCTMIEINSRIYFIDMGVMVIDDLITRGISVDAVKAVFFTHMHGDHTNGLLHFADLLSWYFKTPDPVIHLPRVSAVKAVSSWLEANGTPLRDLQFKQVEAGLLYEDDFIRVTAIATQHCPDSFAYLVEAEDKAVLFTGDLKRPGVDFPAIANEKDLDLVICESAHFPATEYLPIFEACKPKQICVNHYSSRFHKSVLEMVEQVGIPAKLATDNLEIVL